jgi:exosortase/archaeosortase family protein
VLRFAGAWVVALLLFAFFPGIERMAIANTIDSMIVVASWFGVHTALVGKYVHVGTVTLEIVPDCTPLLPIATLWSAVLAFPAPWRARLMGLAAGAAVLWAYNLLRIFVLVGVLRWKPGWFEFVHVYMWQTITLVVVFGLFLAWIRITGSIEAPPAEAAPA